MKSLVLRLRDANRKYLRYAGFGVAIVAVLFLGFAVRENLPEIRSLILRANRSLLGMSIVPLLASHVVAAVLAQRILMFHGATRIRILDLYSVIFASNLAKYIPGGVWQVGSQFQMARGKGLTKKQSGSLWLDQAIFGVGAGIIVVAVLLPVAPDMIPVSPLYGIPVVVLAVIGTSPHFRKYAYTRLRLKTATSNDSVALWLESLSIAIIGAGLLGLHGYLLTLALEPTAGITLAAATVVFVGAWVIGFVVFFVPNGLGVRDAAIVAGFSPWLSPAAGLAIAASSRLVFLLADIWAGMVAGSIHATPRSSATPEKGENSD